MSEHISLQGEMVFHHLPYDWSGGMVFCKRCKKVSQKAAIKLDEGFRVSVVCHRCKKVIWTTKEHEVIFPVDNKKCEVCKKKTNKYDCVCYGVRNYKKGVFYICSKRCYSIHLKEDD